MLFPPFCFIPRALQKIRKDKARGITVIQDWAIQPWHAAAARMLVDTPELVSQKQSANMTRTNGAKALAAQNSQTDHMRSVRGRLRLTGSPQQAASVISSSW